MEYRWFVWYFTINVAEIFESIFMDNNPKKLELQRENGNNAEAKFLGLHINRKKDVFFFSASWECLKNPVTAEACNNQNSFLISMNSLVRCMISQGAKRCRIANVRVKVFNKHPSNVNYVTKTRNNLLAIIWFWY